MRRAVAACVLAVCCVAPPFGSPPPQRGRAEEPVQSEREIAKLIHDLGSASFEARRAATQRLLEWEKPPAALRAALKSSDPERVRRATRIINAITQRDENVAFGKLTEYARRGEIDRLAELLARRPKWDDEDACWQVLAELEGRLTGLEKKKYQRTSFPARGGLFAGDFRCYLQHVRPRRVASRNAALTHGPFVVRAESISAEGVDRGLLVSSRCTQVNHLTSCLVLAGGPVEVGVMSSDSIIVCDGDFNSRYHAARCLIIARGDVRFSGTVVDCHVITSGSVHFGSGKIRRNNDIKEHEPNPLGFVKWFDPAGVGITVEADGGVRIKAAAAGKAFARAGLRAGDLVAAVDGEAVKSPDDFRLLLRSKLADGGKMVFAVRRAGQVLKLPVRCKD